MKSLLDTHTLIWFLNGDSVISEKARLEIENKEANYVSIASVWEIAIKISIGKLDLKYSFEKFLSRIQLYSFKILPVSAADALTVSLMPFHHRDPFDRMIIAQAMNNRLQILTKDNIFAKYNVEILW